MDGGQDLIDRQQDADAWRRERSIDDIFLPGPSPAGEEDAGADARDAPCVVVRDIVVDGADDVPARARLQSLVDRHRGECLGTDRLRGLQGALTRALVADGYVTSRVLLPAQDLSAGVLRLVVVPGRLEAYAADGLPARTLRMALPLRTGDLLHLPALEQGIENLQRLPGHRVRFDIEPGAAHGKSRVRVIRDAGDRWQPEASVDGRGIEDRADTRGRVALTAGNALGFAERVTVAAGGKLDTHRLDRSENLAVDIDVPFGFWRVAASHDTQQYRDAVAGILTTFVSDGRTRTMRLEAGRVLHRRGNTRYALTAIAGEATVGNRIDGTTLAVSSYTLRTAALRVEHDAVAAGARWTTWLTAETGDAAGPATRPLGGAATADTDATRLQLFLRRTQPLADGQSAITATLTGQYSASRLYPLQQMSLLADSSVRGFVDQGANAATAMATRVEWTRNVAAAAGRVPGALQVYAGVDMAWAGNDNTVAAATRAAAGTLGLVWHGERWQWRVEASDPVGGVSTTGGTAPVLATTVVWTP